MKLNPAPNYMWFRSNNEIQEYHRAMIASHGAESSLALGWRERADQLLRFEVLAQIGDMNGYTVLDAGCGYADLYPFLKSRYPQISSYHGIDQVPEMIARASERFPGINLQQGDFIREKLQVCDYVLASGSLNYGQDIFPPSGNCIVHVRLAWVLTYCVK